MPDAQRPKSRAAYDRNVFINCPFDDSYEPIFRGLVFAVFECGLVPRCAKEAYDSGQVRMEKILGIIGECRWGIHDISRTDLNDHGLPRFNMPLELGLFLGARRFGHDLQRRKSCIVLDHSPYRYQAFISDMAGQDIAAHDNRPERAIRVVRDWLATEKAGIPNPPGGAAIAARYAVFERELPALCAQTHRSSAELTYIEFADLVSTWLKQELTRRVPKPDTGAQR